MTSSMLVGAPRPDVNAMLALLSTPTPTPASALPTRTSAQGPLRCCFVLPDASALLAADGIGYFGGAEIRGVTLLRALASRADFEMCAVVCGEAGATMRGVDGIPLFCRPPLKYYEGQHDGNDSAYAQANADVYVVFGANELSAEVARFCRRRGRRLVVSIASDAAFDPDVREGATVRDVYGTPKHYVWFGLAHADRLVVQTASQGDRLTTQFGRTSALVRNPLPVSVIRAPRTAPSKSPQVIWIGRLDHNKRPREALQLAAVMPDVRMTIVMNGWDGIPAAERKALQEKRPTTTFIDSLPPDALAELIAEHDLLINTSLTEGFPNTFLQAGASSVPVVSMRVDPGGLLREHGGGVIADDTVVGMVLAIRGLLQDRARYAQCSRRLHEYVMSHHDPVRSAADFAQVLLSTVDPTDAATDWRIR